MTEQWPPPQGLQPDNPIPGNYKRRLVRGGPWVGVSIFWRQPIDPGNGEPIDRAPILTCIVDGEERDPYMEWTYCCGNRITEHDYNLLRHRAMSADRLPPDQPINLSNLKPLGF